MLVTRSKVGKGLLILSPSASSSSWSELEATAGARVLGVSIHIIRRFCYVFVKTKLADQLANTDKALGAEQSVNSNTPSIRCKS